MTDGALELVLAGPGLLQRLLIHLMKDGKVARWSDYWDVSNFVGQFPAWFPEEMAKGTAADFSRD